MFAAFSLSVPKIESLKREWETGWGRATEDSTIKVKSSSLFSIIFCSDPYPRVNNKKSVQKI